MEVILPNAIIPEESPQTWLGPDLVPEAQQTGNYVDLNTPLERGLEG